MRIELQETTVVIKSSSNCVAVIFVGIRKVDLEFNKGDSSSYLTAFATPCHGSRVISKIFCRLKYDTRSATFREKDM